MCPEACLTEGTATLLHAFRTPIEIGTLPGAGPEGTVGLRELLLNAMAGRLVGWLGY